MDREGARCIEETDNIDHSELSDCITDYINTRLGCILPWTGAKLNKTGNWTHCHSYEHVSFDMTTLFNMNHKEESSYLDHNVISSKMMDYIDIMENIVDVGEDVVTMTNCLVPCRR